LRIRGNVADEASHLKNVNLLFLRMDLQLPAKVKVVSAARNPEARFRVATSENGKVWVLE